MNQHPRIFYHAGFERTGTTFLQKNVFPHFKGIRYISKWQISEAIGIVAAGESHTYLISKEPDMSGKFTDQVQWMARHFPEAQPIVVLRPHATWVQSQYKRFLKNGYCRLFPELLDLENDHGWFKQRDLFYCDKLALLQDLFDHPPIVFLYDDLWKDPHQFVNRIADLTGALVDWEGISLEARHTSYTETQLIVLRKVMSYVNLRRRVWALDSKWYKLQVFCKKAVAYAVLSIAGLLPEHAARQPLIPPQKLAQVERFYAEDWRNSLKWVQK